MYKWKHQREVSYEEFKELVMEWNKTCKLLTSGSFYLNISHNSELFHERWFYSILKDVYPNVAERTSELQFILASRLQSTAEKLKETPFMGYDFNEKQIYSLDDDHMKLVNNIYKLLDPESNLTF